LRQLALQIQSAATPTLDNFVPGRNAEALAALRAALATPTCGNGHWGRAGAGR
jgi:DnaA family protein